MAENKNEKCWNILYINWYKRRPRGLLWEDSTQYLDRISAEAIQFIPTDQLTDYYDPDDL